MLVELVDAGTVVQDNVGVQYKYFSFACRKRNHRTSWESWMVAGDPMNRSTQ
jgi:hypothetical protein